MATVRFINRSIKDYAPLTMRLEHEKKQYQVTTNIMVEQDFKDYYKKNVHKRELRNKQNELDKKIKPLEKYVYDAINKLENETLLPKTWLKELYANYLNPDNIEIDKLNITYWFDHKIKNHKKIKNAKGGFGLSPDTLKGIKTKKRNVLRYEDERLKRKLKLSDMTQVGFDSIKDYLLDIGLKSTTIQKLLGEIKSIGRYAQKKQMKLPDSFGVVEIERTKTHVGDEDVIYLTNDELERIISLDLKQDYLINAQKWLLLGCYTGQRIDDQLSKFTKGNIHGSGDDLEIHLTQGKTGTKVTIPVHPNIRNILKPENMPHAISSQRLNDYMKEICKLAEINEPIDNQKKEFIKKEIILGKEENVYRHIKKVRPKYEYISSHTGRRTFCMMYFQKMTNQAIMAVTGHKKESSFLTYINQTNDIHLQIFKDYFAKLK